MHISTLGYALLARLARKPHSGYELLQALKKPIGFFWQAGQSQIYPELKRLETLELVTFELVEQLNRPDKRVYSMTVKGREALRKWVVSSVELEPSRNEVLLKTYSLWLADPVQGLEFFRAQEDLHVNQFTQYERILADIQAEHATPLQVHEPLFGDYATLQMGLRYEREYVDWCRWMIEQLEHSLHEPEEISAEKLKQ